MSNASSRRRFRLTGSLLCDDVRLSTLIEVIVHLDRAPSTAEAMRLLEPSADAKVARQGGEGCPYELSDFTIAEETASARRDDDPRSIVATTDRDGVRYVVWLRSRGGVMLSLFEPGGGLRSERELPSSRGDLSDTADLDRSIAACLGAGGSHGAGTPWTYWITVSAK
jgi:hypothetical protein